MVFTTPAHFTLPLAVANLPVHVHQDTARVFAFTALSMMPALAVFVFAQRQIVGGLTGAVKG